MKKNNEKTLTGINGKRKHKNQTLSAVGSYIGCIGIALFVTFVLNGMVGILVTIALICAGILSVIVTFAVRRSITAEAKLNKVSVSKGESFKCIITVEKSTVIPAPFLEISIGCSGQLSKEIDICRLSLFGKEKNVIEMQLTALCSGAAEVKLNEVLLCDYLGIIRLPIKMSDDSIRMTIAVLPDIPDVPIQTDFIKRAFFSLSDDDEDEEETNENTLGQTGQPGYDYREYIPGDSIKRINWKLSSKRNMYMIRLDELAASSGQLFFLDCPIFSDNEDEYFRYAIRDCVIEGLLAVFVMMVREGREAIMYFPEKGNWQRCDIRTMKDVSLLQDKFSAFQQTKLNDVFPPELADTEKTPICFSAASADNQLSATLILSEHPNVILVCAESSNLSLMGYEIWRISDDFEIKKS